MPRAQTLLEVGKLVDAYFCLAVGSAVSQTRLHFFHHPLNYNYGSDFHTPLVLFSLVKNFRFVRNFPLFPPSKSICSGLHTLSMPSVNLLMKFSI